MKNNIAQNQLKLFQKLYSILPSIKNISNNKDKFNFNKEVSVIYYNNDKTFWFTKGEKENNCYFLFGFKHIGSASLNDATFVIDISLSQEFSLNSMGALYKESNDIKLLLNKDILNERYPNINVDAFNTKVVEVRGNKVTYIDLGFFNENFIENLENILNQTKVNTLNKTCKICNQDIDSVKFDSRLRNLKKLNTKYCGRCIEKIVLCEFFNRVEAFLTNNESKTLKIASEKFGNAELFDYGIKLLEKYKILNYVSAKKLLFTLDRSNEILKNYFQYIDEDNPLIDEIFKNNTQHGSLSKNTQVSMNLFINALNAGKNHDDALKISKLNKDNINTWFNLGKKGDSNYIDFYNKYKKFKKKEDGLDKFLSCLKKHKNLQKALKYSKTNIESINKWYNLGKNGDEDYLSFYKQCKQLLSNELAVKSNEKTMEEFIQLKKKGKTNSQAINQLKIPDVKVKNWINQAKIGNSKFTDFYNAYNEDKKDNCKICGRKINSKNKKEICKRCEKKQFAAKILIKLLDFIEPEKEFKKDDLKSLKLQSIQITEYIWTLKEFNLVSEKNNKYALKSRNELEEFIKSSGLDVKLPQKTKNNLYKTCVKCKKSLKKSQFSEGDDVCKNCKKTDITKKYLAEILQHVNYGEEFSEGDLKKYFKDPFKLQAKLWSLADNDLVKKNFNDNTYVLATKNEIDEFLGKNATEDDVKKISQENVLTKLSEGLTRFQASQATGVSFDDVTNWYKSGKANENNDDVYFYNKVNEFETINMLNQYLDNFKEGNYVSVSDKTLKEWIDKGTRGIAPYDDFYKKYKKLNKTETFQINPLKYPGYKKVVSQMNTIIQKLKDGFGEAQAVDEVGIKFDTYKYWINRGKQNFGELYTEFYNNVGRIQFGREESILTLIPDELEKELKKYSKGNQTGFAWVNKVGKYYQYGKTVDGEYFSIKDKDIHKLYDKVKKAGHIWGVRDLNKAKSIVESKNHDDGIYKELSKEYLDKFPNKSNMTGIAWVNKVGNNFVYSRTVNGEIVKFSNKDIYKLYDEVKNEGHVWGIRNYENASKFIDIPENHVKVEVKSEVDDTQNNGILAELSKEYLDKFPNKSNMTGIAWVNKIGNNFIYSRTVDGENIRLVDSDIYKLYERVKDEGHVWGIRNYENASKFISPDGKPAEVIKEDIEIIEDVDTDIYASLPDKYLNTCENTNTGIAWVNKVRDRWVYSFQVDKTIIRLTHKDIFKLHEKVLEYNGAWGIIDIEKARAIIDPDSVKNSKTGNVIVDYIERSKSKLNVLIKGTIKHNELFKVLNKLNLFESDFKRIITTSTGTKVDLFLELEINRNSKNVFDDKIKDFGWKINK